MLTKPAFIENLDYLLCVAVATNRVLITGPKYDFSVETE